MGLNTYAMHTLIEVETISAQPEHAWNKTKNSLLVCVCVCQLRNSNERRRQKNNIFVASEVHPFDCDNPPCSSSHLAVFNRISFFSFYDVMCSKPSRAYSWNIDDYEKVWNVTKTKTKQKIWTVRRTNRKSADKTRTKITWIAMKTQCTEHRRRSSAPICSLSRYFQSEDAGLSLYTFLIRTQSCTVHERHLLCHAVLKSRQFVLCQRSSVKYLPVTKCDTKRSKRVYQKRRHRQPWKDIRDNEKFFFKKKKRKIRLRIYDAFNCPNSI